MNIELFKFIGSGNELFCLLIHILYKYHQEISKMIIIIRMIDATRTGSSMEVRVVRDHILETGELVWPQPSRPTYIKQHDTRFHPYKQQFVHRTLQNKK